MYHSTHTAATRWSNDDFKFAIGQKAVRAYSTRITIIESLEFEPEDELCDDSWMEYINEDCMTDGSDPSRPRPFSPYERIKEPVYRWRTYRQKLTAIQYARKLIGANTSQSAESFNLARLLVKPLCFSKPSPTGFDCMPRHYDKLELLYRIPEHGLFLVKESQIIPRV